MSPAIWGVIFLLAVLAACGAYFLGDARGYEAGRCEQRRLISQAVDELKQQEAIAQRDIDYLYQQARARIDQEMGPQ